MLALCEYGYFKELCYVALVNIYALWTYEYCDYVSSICMKELWNLIIVEQDVKKYELCTLYIDSIQVMIRYLMAWIMHSHNYYEYAKYVHYVIEYEIYDIVHYMLSMRFYGI